MSCINKISMTDLGGTVSFGGGGGGGGDDDRSSRRDNVGTGAAAVACAAGTYISQSIPAVTPPTTVAKVAATGATIVACGIATAPLTNRD